MTNRCPNCNHAMAHCDDRNPDGERQQPDWWQCPECGHCEPDDQTETKSSPFKEVYDGGLGRMVYEM
ncbi:MAG: hypothetical protein JWR69_3035 [Pedosphaera sp.]|nr:hypothetical protein [Pedosphaera sp.]